MVELHVLPDPRRATWQVTGPGASSEHATANEAERAARSEAERGRCDRIVLHDRYGRTRELVVGRRPGRG
jgi:hypothetical protein